ncbi:acetyl-CoA carboxylase biotin carboxyl carrier protein [Formicincola oecophyllae]|uniref:Biotin carboxyl carrier protein of acetyl-CoA carboxylase n=2 Tax=Formicincola oecophyllae TaxID=2558361 RepID=A0A4Y6UBV6_9PROT|nr:acetyl-CoA carboxylase biotin carboxyl carrier protein [Formicincola oecophyllae]
MLVDREALRALADILAETGLTEIELAEGENRIRVVRAPAPVAPQPATVTVPAAVQQVPAAPASNEDEHPGIVPSPMVGVAYLTPDPASPPFVQDGAMVREGDTIMLVEAMKTFNQIKAPRSGKFVRYLVTSGEPVEFGAPLAIIE